MSIPCKLILASTCLALAATTSWAVDTQVFTFSTLAGISSSTQSPGSADGLGANARFSFPDGVAVDPTGNLYVADAYNNTIRKLTPAGTNWQVTTFAGEANWSDSADGNGTNAHFSYPSRMAFDRAGNLYVADMVNALIRKITPAGDVTTIAGQARVYGADNGVGTNALFRYPAGLAVDQATNLYVADTDNCLIRKITPAGVVTTIAGKMLFPGAADGVGTNATFNYPHGIAVDNATNLYVADTQNNTIRKLVFNGSDWVVSTLAGSPGSAGGVNGTGADARFDWPEGIAVDTNGTLYVADLDNHLIRTITMGGVVSTLAGRVRIPGSADGTGTNAFFYAPAAVALDAAGNLYVTDAYNNIVRKVTPAGVVTTLAGLASTGSTDGATNVATFAQPYSLALDGATNLYVTDSVNDTIRKVTPSGIVTTLAGQVGVRGSADGTGTNAQFNAALGIVSDPGGTLYVADTYNQTIRKITPAGVVTTIVGTPGMASWLDGTNTDAGFFDPYALAIDAATNLYVADTYNQLIRKISPVGTNWVVTTLAGSLNNSGSIDAAGTNAQFNYPAAIAVDRDTNLYVSDSNNHTIRKLSLVGTNWVVTTIAGQATLSGSADGVGTNALFYNPSGIVVDAATNLFVADSHNHTLRKLARSGTNWVVTTVGGQPGNWGGEDGTSFHARFQTPYGLAIDKGGNLYVADTLNNTLRLGTVHTLPALQISRAGTMVTLTWPGWASEFELESIPSLSPGDYWSNLPGATLVGNNFVLTNDVSAGKTFYRLYLP